MEVPQLGKPGGTRCPHQAERGCSIYAERPEPCRNFKCAWRANSGLTHERPDKLGVFLCFVPTPQFGEIAKLYETRARALVEEPVRAFITRMKLCERYIVIGHQHRNPAATVVLGGPEPRLTEYCEARGHPVPGGPG